MVEALRKLIQYLPLLFGIGFIAPLTAQLMVSFGIEAPLGLTPLAVGLAFGGAWGLYAQMRGRWI
jgi:hypothetical protein